MMRTWGSNAVAGGLHALVNGVVPVLFALSVDIVTLDAASAHEVRPAYLELREDKPNEFSLLLKTPMRGDARLALAAVFSGKTENISPIVSRPTADAVVQKWRMRAIEPLAGQKVFIDGLRSTMTDVLVRVELQTAAHGSSG